MTSRGIRSIALPAVFGFAAPFLWVTALGWWALYTSEPLIRWIWANLHVKGAIAVLALTVVDTVVFALLFGLALRILAGASWRLPVIAFGLAFVVSVLAEAAWSGDASLLGYMAPRVAALLVCTALVHAALSRTSAQ